MISSELLKDAQRAGLRRLPARTGLQDAAKAAGFAAFAADLGAAATLEAAFPILAQALDFPDWFGHNLDALMDCLTDMSWAPARGYLLLLSGTAPLAKADPDGFASLLEVLAGAIEPWREDGIPFWVLADDPSLPDAA